MAKDSNLNNEKDKLGKEAEQSLGEKKPKSGAKGKNKSNKAKKPKAKAKKPTVKKENSETVPVKAPEIKVLEPEVAAIELPETEIVKPEKLKDIQQEADTIVAEIIEEVTEDFHQQEKENEALDTKVQAVKAGINAQKYADEGIKEKWKTPTPPTKEPVKETVKEADSEMPPPKKAKKQNVAEDVNMLMNTPKEPFWNKKTKKTALLLVVGVLTLVLVVLIAFAAVAGSSKDIFVKNSAINGIDVSGMTAEEAESLSNSNFTEKNFTIKNSKRSVAVLGSSFNYKEELESGLDEIINAQTFSQKLSKKAVDHTVPVKISFDDEKLRNASQSLGATINQGGTPSENATIVREGNDFVITEDTLGDIVDPNLVYSEFVKVVQAGGDELNLDDFDLYLKAAVTKQAMEENKVVEKVNQIMNLNIGFDFGYTTETVPVDRLSSWVDFDPDTGEITLNEEGVRAYVVKLAQKYDTLGINRSFATTGGGEITVGGGIYGWQMNVADTTKSLTEKILGLEAGIHEPNYTTLGLTREENNKDIGPTYIEIDLTRQTMWFYKDGSLFLETPIVSGLPGTSRETPTGLFSVWSKETKRYISGEDYRLWVDYWIPINWSGIGIHDASWQASFGGDRYLVYGSHGCLNTPYDKVASIYDNVELNTPVIVYKS